MKVEIHTAQIHTAHTPPFKSTSAKSTTLAPSMSLSPRPVFIFATAIPIIQLSFQPRQHALPHCVRSAATLMDLPYLLHLQRKLPGTRRRSTFPLGALPSDLLHIVLSFLCTPPKLHAPPLSSLSPSPSPSPPPPSPSLTLLLSLRPVCRALLARLHPLLLRLHPTIHLLISPTNIDRLSSLASSPFPLPALHLNGGLLRQQQLSLFVCSLPSLRHLTALTLIRCPSILPSLLPLLPGLPSLTSLTLSHMPLPSPPPLLPHLHHLQVGVVHEGCPAGALDGFLSRLPGLTSLALVSCQRRGTETVPGYATTGVKGLRRVRWEGFYLRKGAELALRGSDGLDEVKWVGCDVTDGFLAAVKGLRAARVVLRGSAMRPWKDEAAEAMARGMAGMVGVEEVDLRAVKGGASTLLDLMPHCRRVRWTTAEGEDVDERRAATADAASGG